MKVLFDFTIPPNIRYTGGPSEISLQLLTADQELTASRLGRFDVMKTQYEAVKLAIAALDKKVVSPATGEVDTFWEKIGPKGRSLILQSYNRVSAPSQEDEASFLASEKARTVD